MEPLYDADRVTSKSKGAIDDDIGRVGAYIQAFYVLFKENRGMSEVVIVQICQKVVRRKYRISTRESILFCSIVKRK